MTVKKSRNAGISALARVAAEKKAAALKRKKARAEALIALILRRKARIVDDFYDIGEALRVILREKLYESLGYASFEALLTARELLGISQATKLIAVVEQVPREQAVRLGSEKAYALVSYAGATPAADSPASLVADDARIDGKPVSSSSSRDLLAATRKVRAAVRDARPATPGATARRRGAAPFATRSRRS